MFYWVYIITKFLCNGEYWSYYFRLVSFNLSCCQFKFQLPFKLICYVVDDLVIIILFLWVYVTTNSNFSSFLSLYAYAIDNLVITILFLGVYITANSNFSSLLCCYRPISLGASYCKFKTPPCFWNSYHHLSVMS